MSNSKDYAETSNKFLITHSIKETYKRKCYFFLCFFACFLVCLVSLISKTVLSQGPIIFLMLAELKAGEMDIIMRNQPMPNYLKIEGVLNGPEDYRTYFSFLNYTKFIEENKEFRDVSEQSASRLNFYASAGTCKGCEEILVDFYLIDSDKESEIELGRSYPYGKMGEGECIIHQNIADKINIKDKRIFVSVNMDVLLRNILLNTYYDNITHPYDENINLIMNIPTVVGFWCDVKYKIEQNYGKLGQDNHLLLMMEQNSFFNFLGKNLKSEYSKLFPDFIEVLNKLNISDYSNQIIINFPKPRINSYLVSNIDDLQYSGVSRANKIVKSVGEIGRNNLKLEMPVIDQMKPLFYGSVFLGLILNVIIIILFVLSLILIHSLLVITTETNSFELGILRILGTTKLGVIKIVIFQCLCFSIPACFAAYLIHFSVLDIIGKILSKYTDNGTHFQQNLNSVIFSFILCNLAPLIAAIYPIKNIISKNLALSLSTSHKTSGVHIEIISAAEKEQQTLITFGVLTFLYGASIYYFLPLSLLSLNLTLLLAIFLWILIGMLLGFIVLSLNIENIIQKVFTHIFLFWTNSYTKIMILKNLTTHRIRNRQTSLMYALSVGFFIMITVGLDIELKSLTLSQLSKRGSYVELINSGNNIDPITIAMSIETMLSLKAIEDYTFISANLGKTCFGAKNKIINFGKSMDFSVDVYAVPPNFYDVTEKVFLKIDEEIENDKNYSLGERMYSQSNEGRIGVSGIFTWEIDLHINDKFYLNTSKDSKEIPMIFKPSFILHSSPALKMSAEPSTMYQRAMVIPIHTYIDLMNKCYGYFVDDRKMIKSFSFDKFPIDRILLKLNPNMNQDMAIKIIKDIVWKDPSYMVMYWFYKDSQNNIDKISNICNVIFSGVSIIVLIFCFFNLSASVTLNISEQKKEIAILRSLGMTSNKILFIYISEGFILIFCASFIGLIIGSIISWTMTLQRTIFTNLPLHFEFPYYQLIFIILASLIGGFLSTIFPAKKMLSNSISNLIRN